VRFSKSTNYPCEDSNPELIEYTTSVDWGWETIFHIILEVIEVSFRQNGVVIFSSFLSNTVIPKLHTLGRLVKYNRFIGNLTRMRRSVRIKISVLKSSSTMPNDGIISLILDNKNSVFTVSSSLRIPRYSNKGNIIKMSDSVPI